MSANVPATRSDFGRVWDVPIELTVEVARTQAPMRDTLSLRSGAIVPLNRLASDPVELRAAGRLLALGEVVVIDEEFGIRVTEVIGCGGSPLDAEAVPDAGEAALEELSAWQAAQGEHADDALAIIDG